MFFFLLYTTVPKGRIFSPPQNVNDINSIPSFVSIQSLCDYVLFGLDGNTDILAVLKTFIPSELKETPLQHCLSTSTLSSRKIYTMS